MELHELKQKRLNAKLTLRYVSGKTGISTSYICDLENGNRKNPSKKIMKILSEFFDCDMVDDEKTKALDGGKKFDDGKPDISLVPSSSIIAMAKVFEYGSKKYGKNNWKNGINYSRLYSATMRHLIAFFENDTLEDDESGLHPLWHAIANIAMLIHYENIELFEFDDRQVINK